MIKPVTCGERVRQDAFAESGKCNKSELDAGFSQGAATSSHDMKDIPSHA
jgi:hypothetical protein